MFFSVIVPTYNPGNYLPKLLKSIQQNQCLDDIEIILSDDCSEENFDSILSDFSNLNIRKIKNKHHTGFPRTGRENGMNCAEGKWVCFCDQDDYFIDNAFDKVKAFILDTKAESYLICNFIQEIAETGERSLVDASFGWTHGKFYERAFLIEHDVHYDNVRYCEDTNFTTKISCIMIEERKNVFHFGEPVYVWHKTKDSLSDHKYFVNSMTDYINATFGVIIKYIEKYMNNQGSEAFGDYVTQFMRTFIHVYFYLQTPHFKNRNDKVIEAVSCLTPFFNRFKAAVGINNDKIIEFITTSPEHMNFYNETRVVDSRQIPFVESICFADWIKCYF